MHKENCTIGLVFGGPSSEHEISIKSANNIGQLLRGEYNFIPIYISVEGDWYTSKTQQIEPYNRSEFTVPVTLKHRGELVRRDNQNKYEKLNAVFSTIHGGFGEDGVLQGYFQALQVPIVGNMGNGAVLSFDKHIAKLIASNHAIEVANYIAISHRQNVPTEKIWDDLGPGLFVKPTRQGSSIGVSKVNSLTTQTQAIDHAFKYDSKILIEECIVGREIEVGVFKKSDGKVVCSMPGEIIVKSADKFYDYSAKYETEGGAKLCVPANLSPNTIQRLQNQAATIANALDCENLVRIDFFVTSDQRIFFNEANSVPGFTNTSLYLRLFEPLGYSPIDVVSELIHRVIE